MKIFRGFISKIGIVFLMVLAIGTFTGGNVFAVDDSEIGTHNLNDTAQNSAKIGDTLSRPEKGWRRYDGTDKYVDFYGKGWNGGSIYIDAYRRTSKMTSDTNDYLSFKFTGDKIRIVLDSVSYFGSSGNDKINVSIDGIKESFRTSLSKYPTLAYEKLNLANGEHNVIITLKEVNNFDFDAIDVSENGSVKQVVSGFSLNKTALSLNVNQQENLVAKINTESTANKCIYWKSANPDIATVDKNGKVTGVKVGNTTIEARLDMSDIVVTCAVTVTEAPINKTVLNIEPEKNKIKRSETVTANLTIDNIKEIAAEDIRIKYDAEKLQFLNVEEVDGIKLVKNDTKTGELRFILASKGEANIVKAKKTLLKLNFKGIKTGEALVDVVKGRVSDGIEMENNLTDEQCGQGTIIIEDLKDVNNSGEFTLLDLAIDARHLGKDPKSTELTKYNTDIVVNNAIDDDDLLEIGKFMLENPNYEFNK